jgi:DNA-binding IclR family transcriptional regulator
MIRDSHRSAAVTPLSARRLARHSRNGGPLKYRVPSVEKAFAILDMFVTGNRSYTMSEVGRHLNLPVSTTSSLLNTLQYCGYLSRDDKGRFALTMKLISQASETLGRMQLREIAEPELKRLTGATGQASVLALLDGNELVYIDKIEGTSEIRLASYVGRRLALHLSSTGKVLLAYLPEEEVDRIIAAVGLPAATPKTITSPATLKRELAKIRKRGYATDNQESGLGIRGVGAPVFDHNGSVVASIAIGGSVFELNKNFKHYIHLVRNTARKISENLGH